jgi:hypothetical protein
LITLKFRISYPFQPVPNDFLPGVSARTFWLFVWDDKQKLGG